jgi:hypothetical protein
LKVSSAVTEKSLVNLGAGGEFALQLGSPQYQSDLRNIQKFPLSKALFTLEIPKKFRVFHVFMWFFAAIWSDEATFSLYFRHTSTQ